MKEDCDTDAISPLDNHGIIDILSNQHLPLSLGLILPESIMRLWIYDTGENEINHVIRLDETGKPLRAYYLVDPLTKGRLNGFYDFPTPKGLSVAPKGLLADYRHRLKRLW